MTPRSRVRPLYLALAGLLCVPIAVTEARGHDMWNWIRQGDYRSAMGTTCCTERDCYRGGVANLKRVGDGFDFDATDHDGKTYHVHVPMESVHGSVDASAWYCALPQDLLGGRARCLFLPGSV